MEKAAHRKKTEQTEGHPPQEDGPFIEPIEICQHIIDQLGLSVPLMEDVENSMVAAVDRLENVLGPTKLPSRAKACLIRRFFLQALAAHRLDQIEESLQTIPADTSERIQESVLECVRLSRELDASSLRAPAEGHRWADPLLWVPVLRNFTSPDVRRQNVELGHVRDALLGAIAYALNEQESRLLREGVQLRDVCLILAGAM